MDRIRKPFFILALVAAALVVLLELGSPLLVKGVEKTGAQKIAEIRRTGVEGADDLKAEELPSGKEPPGLGIAYMALVDGQWLYMLVIVGLSFLEIERLLGRVQGIVTLVFMILLIIASILLAIVAFVKLMIMIGLFLAAPFGTIAYIAKWGFFDKGGASAILSLIMFLKLGAAVCIVLAHQGFLKNKSLILLTLISLVCGVLLAFLHGFVPGVLASITDALGALIIAIIAIIWALIAAIFAIIAVVRAVG